MPPTPPANSAPDPLPRLGGIWRGFVRGSAGTGLAVAGRALGQLLLTKLVAVFGGPGGLTELAQFQNLLGLFRVLPTDGVLVGAVARLAPLRPGAGRYQAWLGVALLLTAVAVLGAGGVLLATSGPAWPAGRVALLTLLVLLLSWQALLSAALLAAGRRTAYVVQSVALGALGTGAAAGALAAGWPLPQVLLAYVAGQALVLAPTVGTAARAGLLQGLRLGRPSGAASRGLLRFVWMAVGNLLFDRAVAYAVRAWLMAHYAPSRTDLWQAVAKLSDGYSPVVAAVLSTVFYPRLAALAGQPAQAQRYLRSVLGLLALGLALGLGALYGLRDTLLPLLFAPHLLAARSLLGPQLLGDWAKFLNWVLLYPLLIRARPLPYLAVEAAAAACYVGLLAGLLPACGLRGMVLAHAIQNGLLLLALVGRLGWQARKPAATRTPGKERAGQ